MRTCLKGVVCCMATAAILALPSTATSGDRQAEYVQLRLLIGEQRFSEALDRCRALIATYPDYVYLYETLAEIALYAEDLGGAAKFFEERIEDGTALELSYFGLGTVYFNMAAYREAALCFDRAIELGVSAPECYRNFVYAYERLEGVDATVRLFNSLCHRDPKNPHLWYAVALAYWSKRDYPTVLKNLDEALSRNPTEQKYLQAKAAVLLLTGRGKEGGPLIVRLLKQAGQESDMTGIQFLTSYHVLRQDREEVPTLNNRLAQQSLESARMFGQFRWIGWWSERLANIEYSRSMYQSAIVHARTAFEASRKCLDNQLALDALIRQVESSMDLGYYDIAIECAYKELEISRDEKDNGRTARSLNDLAWIYHELGMEDIAMEYAIEALGILENTNAANELLTRIYATLGVIYEGVGNYDSALANLIVSDRLIPQGGVWIPHRAVSHGNIGRILLKLGNLEKAKYHFSRELSLSRVTRFNREEAYSLNNLADYYVQKGCTNEASSMYLKAYELSQSIDQKPTLAASARGLARLAAKAGKTMQAIAWYKSSFTVAESMGLVTDGYLLGDRKRNPIESDMREYTKLLLKLGANAEAFNFLERSKLFSRPGDLSLSRIRQACKNLPDSTKQIMVRVCEELEDTGLSLSPHRKSVMTNEPRYDLNRLTKSVLTKIQFQKLLRQIAKEDPVAFEKLKPAAADLREVQKTLLIPSHAIIEYLIGEESCVAFVIEKDTMRVVQLPIGRVELQKLIERIANVFSSDEKQSQSWSANFANFDSKACAEAFDKILRPVLHFVSSVDELTIIPDGILCGLPFECLISQVPEGNSFGISNLVVDKFAINYSYAATCLLPRCRYSGNASEAVLAVGNPEISAVKSELLRNTTLPPALFRPGYGFSPLPGAEREVHAIAREFAGKATVLLKGDATKTTVKMLMSDYKIIHIAAHASIDQESPMSSAIYLASDAETGQAGILRARDILDIDMNARLVVLSSCNTMRYVEGRDVGGFVQGLLEAGVPSVIGCLWGADDNSSALLMARFYHYLSSGERIAKALQKAKRDLIVSGKADPFYWAPFILVGDGSPVDIPPASARSHESWVFAGSLAALVAFCSFVIWICRGSPRTILELLPRPKRLSRGLIPNLRHFKREWRQ